MGTPVEDQFAGLDQSLGPPDAPPTHCFVPGGGVPDAVKVIGLPASGVPEGPLALAVSVLLFAPAVGPSVQLVSAAIPLALVFTTAGDAGTVAPPPAVTVKVTATFGTGLLPASRTTTAGGIATVVPTMPD